MKFKNKADAKVWCETANGCAVAVDKAILRYDKKLQARYRKSGDMRLKRLGDVLYFLSNGFRARLQEEMKKIPTLPPEAKYP